MRSYVVPVRMRRYYALLFMRNNVDIIFLTTYNKLLYSVCFTGGLYIRACTLRRWRENVVPVKLRFPLAKNALHSPTSIISNLRNLGSVQKRWGECPIPMVVTLPMPWLITCLGTRACAARALYSKYPNTYCVVLSR